MNLNYEKIKRKHDSGDSQWTSYSDLFMTLSVVFLLLYVVASLRTGTNMVASQSDLIAAKQEVNQLKDQLKVYEVLKENYVQEGAERKDLEVYKKVMDQIALLEDQARDKREEAVRIADEAKKKESDLNQYQRLVKSIIDANMLSQSKVRSRDAVIQEKAVEIDQKTRELDDLSATVAENKRSLDQNNQRILNIQDELKRKVREVQQAYRAKQRTREKAEAEIARLQAESESQVQNLRAQNLQVANRLKDAESAIAEKNRETERLLGEMGAKERQFQAKMAELDRNHQNGLAAEKAAFEKAMRDQALGAEAKIAQERAYRDALERKNKAYNDAMEGLKGQLAATKAGISDLEKKYQGSMASLGAANDALKKSLKESLEKQNAQRKLAQQIADNFAKAGIKADVNAGTGDVMIHFGGEYFDTGSASLKTGMRATLERLMPVYARSLFEDPKIAPKIGSVEIIGFASPTYQGKYVDPQSLRPEDRQAVNYNMDLSYQRAKSIFEHVFDPNRMQFAHQKQLLPKVKVTGRSYLATDKLPSNGRTPSSVADYCAQHDCRKSQRVVIKFNISEGEEPGK